MLLFTAFGGALGLKGWEERRSSDAALEGQAAREALAVASMARAELVHIQTSFETALQSGLTVSNAASMAGLIAPEQRAPQGSATAVLDGSVSFSVFAQDSTDTWWSAQAPIDRLTPAPRGKRTFSLTDTRETPSGVSMQMDGLSQRLITACSPLSGSLISACVSQTKPAMTATDYNRLLIYFLLLAAPALAVFGLIRTTKANSSQLNWEHASRAQLETRWLELDLGGANGIWTSDDELGTIHLRKPAMEMLAIDGDPRDLPIDQFAELVDDRTENRILKTLKRGKSMGQFQVRFRGRNFASSQHFEMRGGPTKEGLGGVIYDITETVRTENQAKQVEILARAAVEAFPGPFAAWDSRDRLKLWNSNFENMFGISPGIMRVGASYDSIMAEAHKQIRVERPTHEGAGHEFLLLSDMWITFQNRPMANGGKISVGLDISPIKAQEEKLSRSEKKLKRLVADLNRSQGQAEVLAMKLAEQKTKAENASQSKSVFLASMSHELRTPLNAINGFSEMLVNEVYGELGDDRYREYATDILRSGHHLLDMINDILDMAKIESGKMTISRSMIDPIDAVDSAVRMIRRRAEDKDVSMKMNVLNDIPEIDADHRAIRQMVLNLVSNAIKFTDPGGKITVTLMRQDRFVAVSVEDTGIGIPKDDIPRLTNPFEQSSADENRNSHGTGLGLALTKSFAEMHGGKLMIESEEGVGTRVTFILPIRREKKKEATGSTSDASSSDEDERVA